jgi:beta-galactosidase
MLVANGELRVPAVPAGGTGRVPFPPAVPAAGPAAPEAERWLTVTAALAADTPWAAAGHEIAFAQAQLGQPAPRSRRPTPRSRRPTPGCAVLDGDTGQLRRLGPFAVHSAAPDFWRAPTDNDAWTAGAWRRAGLDRLQQRVIAAERGEDELRTQLRIAPAGADFGFLATLTWTSASLLDIHVAPDGSWPCPLPKIGFRLVLDAAIEDVSWFGHGPGEAYRDTQLATRVGRFSAPVSALATPYVRPQENGNRRHARSLTLSAGPGQSLVVTGHPYFDFTVRRWSPELLTAARHTPDLVPDGRTYVHLDAAHHGIGSGSCGPRTLPGHTLMAQTAAYTLSFST